MKNWDIEHKDSVFLCDDHNDLELAAVVGLAFLPTISSVCSSVSEVEEKVEVVTMLGGTTRAHAPPGAVQGVSAVVTAADRPLAVCASKPPPACPLQLCQVKEQRSRPFRTARQDSMLTSQQSVGRKSLSAHPVLNPTLRPLLIPYPAPPFPTSPSGLGQGSCGRQPRALCGCQGAGHGSIRGDAGCHLLTLRPQGQGIGQGEAEGHLNVEVVDHDRLSVHEFTAVSVLILKRTVGLHAFPDPACDLNVFAAVASACMLWFQSVVTRAACGNNDPMSSSLNLAPRTFQTLDFQAP